jgi:hypothetical protein
MLSVLLSVFLFKIVDPLPPSPPTTECAEMKSETCMLRLTKPNSLQSKSRSFIFFVGMAGGAPSSAATKIPNASR